MDADRLKRSAAMAALDLVEGGMIVGLGTGSTAAHFIAALGEKARAGLDIRAAPTSEDTAARARAAGIPLIEPDETTIIDLAVDGTDEIDGRGNLIKGGGGALLREKIIAYAARRFVVIADASKRVAELGAFPLPVEIEKFSWPLTVRALRTILAEHGFERAKMQLRGEELPFISDGGNYIIDCNLSRIHDAPALAAALAAIPGVIETGLFIGLADEAILAGPGGIERLGGFARARASH